MRPSPCHGAGTQVPAPAIIQTSEEMREYCSNEGDGSFIKETKNTRKTERGWLMPSGGSCFGSSACPYPA